MKACERIRSARTEYWEGTMSLREERRVDRHLLRCRGCWELFQNGDPTRIFSRLEEPERDEDFWRGFWPSIRAQLEREGERVAVGGLRYRPVSWLAAAAVLLFFSIGGWFLRVGMSPRGGSPEVAEGLRSLPTVGTVRQAAIRFPTVEVLPSSDSRVYEFHLEEAGEGPTQVILIFDESIDL